MFFRHRRHRPSLFKLLLVILGLGFLVKRHDDLSDCDCTDCDCKDESRAAHRAKLRAFRSKLREAFDVWREDVAEAEPAPAAESSGGPGTTSV